MENVLLIHTIDEKSLYLIRIEAGPESLFFRFIDRLSPGNPLWVAPLIHVEQLASIDFFTVPTATFRVLFVFVVLSHERRRVVHFGATEHPTKEWTMQQIREAFPWDQAPRHVLRDRDAIYGRDFAAMTREMGMEEVLTAPRSPLSLPKTQLTAHQRSKPCSAA